MPDGAPRTRNGYEPNRRLVMTTEVSEKLRFVTRPQTHRGEPPYPRRRWPRVALDDAWTPHGAKKERTCSGVTQAE